MWLSRLLQEGHTGEQDMMPLGSILGRGVCCLHEPSTTGQDGYDARRQVLPLFSTHTGASVVLSQYTVAQLASKAQVREGF